MFSQNFDNFILNTDSYKTSHWLQYPPNTEYVSSILKRVAAIATLKMCYFLVYKLF